MSIWHRSNARGSMAHIDKASQRRLKKEQKRRDRQLYVRDNPLRNIVPHDRYDSGYRFYSDYFTYGSRCGKILTLVESSEADRDLPPFWKIYLIPQSSILNSNPQDDTNDGVYGAHGQLFDMLENKSKSWATKHQRSSENSGNVEGDSVSGYSEKHRVSVLQQDYMLIADDRANGDSYGDTEYKVLITARSLHDLDLAVFNYEQYISTKFDGLHFEVYQGQQRADFSNLLKSADLQLGHHPMATSTEYAGGYEILTRGITDPNGDYIGQMVGDVNNTAVVMDLDNFDNRVIVSHSAQPTMLNVRPNEFDVGTMASTLLGVRIAQSALINNHRVVHLVLNGAKPQNIGADLSDITTVVSLNGGSVDGAINPFEIFGDDPSRSVEAQKKQFSYFPAHIQKLQLMMKQLTSEIEDVDLNDTFTDIIQDYYKDCEMLVDNPKDNYQKLRLTGMKHIRYPKLDRFLVYLNQRRDAAMQNNDQRLVGRIERIRSAFNAMYRNNGDLFNVITNDKVDDAKRSPQVVYDFSSLKKRGKNIAMAQFINALRYAVDSLDERDEVIIHGTDNLDDSVKDYVKDVFTELTHKNIRLVFLYDDTGVCLDDSKFNRLDFADYVFLGGLNKPLLNQYQQLLQQPLPEGLRSAIGNYGGQQYGDSIYYLSRDMDNILFALDMNLGTRHGDQLSENPRGLTFSSADKANHNLRGDSH